MWMNVAQLVNEAIGSTRTHEVSDVVDIDGNGGDSWVQGKVKLTRTNRSIFVRGGLRTEVIVICSRCLDCFRYSLTLTIEEEYFPTTDVMGAASLYVHDEPGCFTIDEHHIIDLTEAVRQYVLVTLPIKPLCCEDCPGLCPSCGHNLNLEPCNCPQQEIVPCWSELTGLALVGDVALNEQKGTE